MRQFLHPLHVYVEKCMNLQLVSLKLKLSERKPLFDAVFPSAELAWEILSYYVTTKGKTGSKVFICMAWSLYRFRNYTQNEKLQHPKNETVRYLKYNFSQLKLYVEEKTVDTGSDTTEFTMAVDNENRQSFIQEPAPLWTVT